MRSHQQSELRQTSGKAADALRATDAAWLKAYEAENIENSAAFYDEQGSMLVPNAPIVTGQDAIAKFIASAFAMQDYRITWHPNNAEVARSGELDMSNSDLPSA